MSHVVSRGLETCCVIQFFEDTSRTALLQYVFTTWQSSNPIFNLGLTNKSWIEFLYVTKNCIRNTFTVPYV